MFGKKKEDIEQREKFTHFNLYVIRDRVAEDIGPVFQSINDGVALRAYWELIGKLQAPKEEFQLLQVGVIDRVKATIEAYKTPIEIDIPDRQEDPNGK